MFFYGFKVFFHFSTNNSIFNSFCKKPYFTYKYLNYRIPRRNDNDCYLF